MDSNVIKILLVEDNLGDARLLQEIFKEGKATKFEIVLVDRISEAIRVLKETDFDLILLDLSLPDSKGIDTFRKISKEKPQIPIVLLTGLDDEALAVKLVQEGAQDYLVKGQINNKILLRSVRYAVERNYKINEQAQRKSEVIESKLAEYKITKREREILVLITEGKTNEEIASVLHLSLSTIRNQIGKIFAKLRVSNRSQATALIVDMGLLKQKVTTAS